MLPSLKEMIGKMVVARIPALDREDMVLVHLCSVEAHGIWIESKHFNEEMMERLQIAASTTALVLFIPFCGILFIVSSVFSVVLSERAFGLDD